LGGTIPILLFTTSFAVVVWLICRCPTTGMTAEQFKENIERDRVKRDKSDRA
jgi:hypothetical protein